MKRILESILLGALTRRPILVAYAEFYMYAPDGALIAGPYADLAHARDELKLADVHYEHPCRIVDNYGFDRTERGLVA